MKPSFLPRLVNDPFADPGLFIPFRFRKRALQFDLGDLGPLTPREILKISHAFVTHTHMDHFVGFDLLLRIFLGRERRLHIFGPADFHRRVEGKLAGYTWNLVHEFQANLELVVHEVREEKILTRTYPCKNGFALDPGTLSERDFNGVLLQEPGFSVRCAVLDHRIPCLGLCLEENFHVNILKQGLADLDLPVGPWLTRFKAALYEKRDPESPFTVTRERGGIPSWEKVFPLGRLSEKIARISPGLKVCYVTDVVGTRENREKIVALAKNSDVLFIEAPFLESEKDVARRKYHLTAREAGLIAAQAAVKDLRLFHLSPRHMGEAHRLVQEATAAFGKSPGGRK